MKAGISSYTYTWAIGVPGKEPDSPMTVYQLIDKATELDVGVIQLADNMPLHHYSENELMLIHKRSKDLNIQIEVGARKMTPENLERYINLAVLFNSPILRFVIDGDGFKPELNEVHAVVHKAIPLLKSNNVILAIENHDRFKATEFVEIVEKADTPWVGICLDSVNSMGAGEGLETVIEKLAPYTVNLHVKEFSVKRIFHQMGFVVEGCPLGTGMLPVDELIQKVSDKCHSAILEQWTPPEQTLTETIQKEALWAQSSINFLKNKLL